LHAGLIAEAIVQLRQDIFQLHASRSGRHQHVIREVSRLGAHAFRRAGLARQRQFGGFFAQLLEAQVGITQQTRRVTR